MLVPRENTESHIRQAPNLAIYRQRGGGDSAITNNGNKTGVADRFPFPIRSHCRKLRRREADPLCLDAFVLGDHLGTDEQDQGTDFQAEQDDDGGGKGAVDQVHE